MFVLCAAAYISQVNAFLYYDKVYETLSPGLTCNGNTWLGIGAYGRIYT